MSNTYILLKDLPDVKAGAEFNLGKGTDAYYLTSEKTGTKYNCYVYPKDFVENNSEWFKLKEQVEEKRIEVGRFSIQKTFGKSLDNVMYEFSCNTHIPTEKYEAVKQAIEWVLNKKDKWDKLNRELDAALESVPTPETQDSKEEPKPLFVTEDGVAVYHNGECWICEEGYFKPYQWIGCCKEGIAKGCKYFFTKAAAEEYILMNKPCLSVSDVCNFLHKEFVFDSIEFENLKQLANHKINNKQ